MTMVEGAQRFEQLGRGGAPRLEAMFGWCEEGVYFIFNAVIDEHFEGN